MKSSHHLFLLSALIIITIQFTPASSADHQLRHGYYHHICPNVESIVRAAVSQKLRQNPVAVPGTLRLFFHDCIVRGCDASVMLVSPTGDDERHHPDDLSLAGDGFDTVVKAKAAVDRDPQCANKVSCADILAMAARDVVNLAGGPFYAVELGRLDGKISTKADVEHNVPQPESNLDQLNNLFANWNLGQTDMIALSGAHTIGFSHCERFKERIYGNDPTMDPAYAMKLRQACPLDVGPTAAVDMDPTTPSTFDNAYYRNLQRGLGLFTSDQVLFTDPRSRGTVEAFASNKTAFEEAFVAAMTKLGRVEVKTGDDDDGEVRRDCSFVN